MHKSFFMKHKRVYNKNSYRWAAFYAARETIVTIIRIGGMFTAMLYLGFMGIQGEMSLGQVFVFITLLRDFIMPLEVSLRYAVSIAVSSVSWGRIRKVLDLRQDPHVNRRSLILHLIQHRFAIFAFHTMGNKIFYTIFLFTCKRESPTFCAGKRMRKVDLLKIMTGLYEPDSGGF